MARIVPITVDALPPCTGLDGGNADNYYRAGQRAAFLGSEVIGPFREALKESTGYSDENMPGEATEIGRKIGGFRFALKATPTTKRPGYKEVFDALGSYLKARLAEYKAGNRPAGVFTIDDEPYIAAGEVLELIRNAKGRTLSRGVKIEITEPELPPEPGSLVVPLGMDVGQLTEGNAALYLGASSMSMGFGRIVEAFEGGLIGLTGFNNENVPAQSEHMYTRAGSHIFHVASIPYDSISYGKVICGLDSEPGRKPESGGDLVLVMTGARLPKLEPYNPKERSGQVLVRADGLRERMDALVRENTETKVRQKPIGHYPVV